MRALPILLLLASCAQAFAEDGHCRPTAEVVAVGQARHWENVVIRGPAMARYVGEDDSVQDPDFVMIQFIPEQKAALIWLGKGDQVCDPDLEDIDMIKRILGQA